MLERTDRIALAVADADRVAESYRLIFDAEVCGDGKDADAAARRVTLRWGRDQVEIFEPAGPGPAAEFVEAGRRGLFAGGFALADPAARAARREAAGVRVCDQGGDRFCVWPGDLGGIGVVLSKRASHEPVGLCDKIWQITYAVPELAGAVARFSELFGLGGVFTNYYDSEHFGYTGAISWFEARDGGPLDSLEYLEPTDAAKNVARFVRRHGAGVYMASIEVRPDDLPELERRLTASGGGWQGTGFGGFIHPRRLGGLLAGVVTYEHWNAQRPLPHGDPA